MGLINFFSKGMPSLLKLPSGSFTVDKCGAVLSATLPSNFPEELIKEVAGRVLSAFRDATQAQLPLSQLIIDYPSLKITARELRGGAIVFLVPKVASTQTANS